MPVTCKTNFQVEKLSVTGKENTPSDASTWKGVNEIFPKAFTFAVCAVLLIGQNRPQNIVRRGV